MVKRVLLIADYGSDKEMYQKVLDELNEYDVVIDNFRLDNDTFDSDGEYSDWDKLIVVPNLSSLKIGKFDNSENKLIISDELDGIMGCFLEEDCETNDENKHPNIMFIVDGEGNVDLSSVGVDEVRSNDKRGNYLGYGEGFYVFLKNEEWLYFSDELYSHDFNKKSGNSLEVKPCVTGKSNYYHLLV